jgi:hypothetical protein
MQDGLTDSQQDGLTGGYSGRIMAILEFGQAGASEYRKVDKQARAAVSEASEKRIVIIRQI